MSINGLSRALVVFYFVEVGLALVIIPWTQFWDRNYFVEAWSTTEAALTSPAIRGAVTGVGIVSLWAAVMETASLLRRRWAQTQELYGEVFPPSS